MFRRILVVHDHSRSSSKAFERALKLIAQGGGELAITAVIRSGEFALDVSFQLLFESARESLTREIAPLEFRARYAGSDPTTIIRTGHPARQIAKVATEWRADLIVTGQDVRVWTIPYLWMSSSVSQLLTLAPCPVLVVP